MEDMEINRSNSEKELDIEEKFTDISTEKECSFSFSALRSRARSESYAGKNLRRSLQICKAKNNVLGQTRRIAKMYQHQIARQDNELLDFYIKSTLVQSKHSGKAIGFIPFKDAYGLYYGFFDSAPEEASFRDHLLHGLCVIITVVFGKWHILLKMKRLVSRTFFRIRKAVRRKFNE